MKWNEIPLIKIMNTKDLQISIKDIKGNNFVGGIAINVGNPHIIFFVENNENFKIENIGPEIEQHQYFPEKCNVTIATIKNKNLINVKAWERGAGLTKACGTAACATAYAGFVTKKTSDNVDIKFTTGILSIRIDQNNSIFMKGPVSNIKEIKVNL
jgi:diaminopimelate epimerase